MDLTPVWLSLKLALTSVALLLPLATPLAWWLAHTRSRLRVLVEAIVALPLVLPPTVLGFYLLILLGPHGPVGAPWVRITGNSLTFSFLGLVVSSVLYSLPFAVQPIHASLEAVGRGPLEAAWTLRASPLDAFWSVGLPMAFRGFLTAAVLAFAHTLGEFGVVLMVGGNIPGQTRVLSIAIYEEVETLNYTAAHTLSLGLLAFSFCALLLVYGINRNWPAARLAVEQRGRAEPGPS